MPYALTEGVLHVAIADPANVHAIDAELLPSTGPLHGVPFGVKDVFDTAGLRTAANFAPYDTRVPTTDAAASVGTAKPTVVSAKPTPPGCTTKSSQISFAGVATAA